MMRSRLGMDFCAAAAGGAGTEGDGLELRLMIRGAA
jgi:hypothetical protein